MVGEACLPSNAYYTRTPDYTLCSGVHVCWSEHSDSSFVYGFMSLDYGFGTMTATTLDPCKHTIMELPHHCYEFGRTAKLCHNFPKSLTIDCVKCFGKVDKGHVEVHILFLAFFLKLLCCKGHVCCSSVFPESTLAFW